jgi:anaerobic selenocysteine-containing dehydrogenase
MTPEIERNHPLQYDAAYGHVLVGGQNGTIAAYAKSGKLLGTVAIQPKVDQCSLDQASHEMACAGSSMLTVVRDNPSGAPTIVTQGAAPAEAHTVGIDAKTKNIWIVWAEAAGDFVRSFSAKP